MKKILILLFILLLQTTILGCTQNQDVTTTEEITTNSSIIELISDNDFSDGFTVSPADRDPQPSNRYPLDYDMTYLNSEESIKWLLKQHGCRFGLADKYAIDGEDISFIDNKYILEDSAKKLIIDVDNSALTFEVNASNEYLKPRADKESWVHLLIEQGLVNQVYINELTELNLSMGITLDKSNRMMTDEEFNINLHTAQFMMYLVLRTDSVADGSDFIWFGIPLYDARYRYVPENGMIDAGTSGNTGMFIYHTPSIDFLPNSLNVGQQEMIDINLIPYISRALSMAKQQDRLLNSSLDNLYVTYMNIGWEVPGTYDISVTISNLSLEGRFDN